MKVLLVEPRYKTYYKPLGLMKISSYHKSKGDEVKFESGFNYFIDYEPDMIYVTSLFSWTFDITCQTALEWKNRFPNADIKIGGVMASLMQKEVEEKTGIPTHFGLLQEVDDFPPDYTLFPDLNHSIGYTTRSCPRKCAWCMVWRIEKEFLIKKNWRDMIDISKPKIIFWDNNFLASPIEHITDVLIQCAEWNLPIDFNQGLDARIFNEEHAQLFSKTKIIPLRFAFDDMNEDKFVQDALKLAGKYDIRDTSCYVLYNFNDKPEDFWYRCKELVKLHCDAFPMKFQPLNAKVKDKFIGKHWTQQRLDNFDLLMRENFMNMVIGRGHKDYPEKHNFWRVFGRTPEEFVHRIDNYHSDKSIVPKKDSLRQIKKKEEEKKEDFSQIQDNEDEIAEVIKKYDGAMNREGAIRLLRSKK